LSLLVVLLPLVLLFVVVIWLLVSKVVTTGERVGEREHVLKKKIPGQYCTLRFVGFFEPNGL
jgi:hypothetical protein